MIYYSYEEFRSDLKVLVKKVDFEFDAILAIARGGLTMGHMLANYYDTKELYSINAHSYNQNEQLDRVEIFNVPDLNRFKKILIVDEMIDSGSTMREIVKLLKSRYPNLDIRVAVIFAKSDALFKPDYSVRENSDWIDFFWEKDVAN